MLIMMIKLPPVISLFFSGEPLPAQVCSAEHAFWPTLFGAFYAFAARTWLAAPGNHWLALLITHDDAVHMPPRQIALNLRLLLQACAVRLDVFAHASNVSSAEDQTLPRERLHHAQDKNGVGDPRYELLGAVGFVRFVLEVFLFDAKPNAKRPSLLELCASGTSLDEVDAPARQGGTLQLQLAVFAKNLHDALSLALAEQDHPFIVGLAQAHQMVLLVTAHVCTLAAQHQQQTPATLHALAKPFQKASTELVSEQLLMSLLSFASLVGTDTSLLDKMSTNSSTTTSALYQLGSSWRDLMKSPFSGAAPHAFDDAPSDKSQSKGASSEGQPVFLPLDSSNLSLAGKETVRSLIVAAHVGERASELLSNLDPRVGLATWADLRGGANLFETMHAALTYWLAQRDLGLIYLFTLARKCRRFRNFLISRAEPEHLLISMMCATLRSLERLDSRRTEPSATSSSYPYEFEHARNGLQSGVMTTLLFCEDWGFCEALHHRKSPPYFGESKFLLEALRVSGLPVQKYTVAGLVSLAMMRVVCSPAYTRVSHAVCVAALCALGNISRALMNVDVFQSDRLVVMLDVLLRRLKKLGAIPASGVTVAATVDGQSQEQQSVAVASSETAAHILELSELLGVTIEIICRILRNGFDANRHLMYALMHRQELCGALNKVQRTPECPTRVRALCGMLTYMIQMLILESERLGFTSASGVAQPMLLTVEQLLDTFAHTSKELDFRALLDAIPEFQYAYSGSVVLL
ncbi:hypothetical protein FVE85_4145 [Porphyridium purpureum]|uniref:Dymeclin n=1 Tax=Porphyridium purpureum TaxID=35688 RepID=A0A5J4YTB9_PORPP|nr:hypothetical protein FVE85_4145 [Porphyridium purpureum]|eukprot:POR1156..scf229_5